MMKFPKFSKIMITKDKNSENHIPETSPFLKAVLLETINQFPVIYNKEMNTQIMGEISRAIAFNKIICRKIITTITIIIILIRILR